MKHVVLIVFYILVLISYANSSSDDTAGSKEYSPERIKVLKSMVLERDRSSSWDLLDKIVKENIVDVIPELVSTLGVATDLSMGALKALAIRNPDREDSIHKYLVNWSNNNMIVFPQDEFTTRELDTYLVFVVSDADGNVQTFDLRNLEKPHSFKFMFESKNNVTKIEINGTSYQLTSLKLFGQSKAKIVSVSKGIVSEFKYPGYLKYSGASADGKLLYFDYQYHRFSYDTTQSVVTNVMKVDPFDDEKTIEKAIYLLTGGKGIKNNSSEWLVVNKLRKQKSIKFKCELMSFDINSGTTTKLAEFLPSSNSAGYGEKCIGSNTEFIAGKYFSTSFGYDSYMRMIAIDSNTGAKLDEGFGGGLVAIDDNDLYYCSSGGYEEFSSFNQIIDARTLKRRETIKLPCPGKTGVVKKFPINGYFVFLEGFLM